MSLGPGSTPGSANGMSLRPAGARGVSPPLSNEPPSAYTAGGGIAGVGVPSRLVSPGHGCGGGCVCVCFLAGHRLQAKWLTPKETVSTQIPLLPFDSSLTRLGGHSPLHTHQHQPSHQNPSRLQALATVGKKARQTNREELRTIPRVKPCPIKPAPSRSGSYRGRGEGRGSCHEFLQKRDGLH